MFKSIGELARFLEANPHLIRASTNTNDIREANYRQRCPGSFRIDADGIVVDGDLMLCGLGVEELPEGIRMLGGLDLGDNPIRTLPQMVLESYCSLRGSQIETLQPNFRVGGFLDTRGCPMRNLPEGLWVHGDLYATTSGQPKVVLPTNYFVGGAIYR